MINAIIEIYVGLPSVKLFNLLINVQIDILES